MKSDACKRGMMIGIPVLILALLAFYWMYFRNDVYLWKVERMSLFLTDDSFFSEKMSVAGGFLHYLGCFFTQLFHFQFWGSVLYAVMIAGLSMLIIWSFGLGTKYAGLAVIPASAVLLTCTELGYMLYVVKLPGYFYAALLGTLFISLFFGLYVRVRRCAGKVSYASSLVMLVLFAFFYAFIGTYAVALLVCCAVYELVAYRLKGIVGAVLAVAGILAVPRILALCVYEGLNLDTLYNVCLPDFLFTDEESSLWYPYIIIGISLVLLSVVSALRMQDAGDAEPVNRTSVVWNVAVSVAALSFSSYTLWNRSFKDEDLYAVLRAERSAEERNWQAVLDATVTDYEPTRAMVLLRNLALFKMGMAGDKIFTYPDGSKEYNIPRTAQVLRLVGARILYFNYGKLNFCYRWCMEDKVEYGLSAEHLIYMTRCSLLNGEWELAEKYIRTLKSTLFYGDLASHYESMLRRPDKVAADPEFKDIIPLMAYNNLLDGDGGLVEIYLLNNFGYMSGGNKQLVELSILSNMISKLPERFWPHFVVYAKNNTELPVHFQEAALLFGWLQNIDVSQFNISDEVRSRFMELVDMAQKGMNDADAANDPIIRGRFGDTYWYYYFFVKGLKTN